MLKFIKWNEENPEHIHMAQNNQFVLFLSDDGIVRYGYMCENYHGNGTSSYVIMHYGSVPTIAHNTFFIPYCEVD